ncbi:hypothetical protein BV25DRAFT_1811065 [Artomyces pyxidatus]|uniref:Uncharacterized protein n=1 Tax=Artomyces pyxidatus TaxID=48021 RepID=A0ACB8SQ51_9AGAM|nr:hypothetical protein BV25DRAFT_1811065 [Artomyces pyxidatus]
MPSRTLLLRYHYDSDWETVISSSTPSRAGSVVDSDWETVTSGHSTGLSSGSSGSGSGESVLSGTVISADASSQGTPSRQNSSRILGRLLNGAWGTIEDLDAIKEDDTSAIVVGFRDGIALLPHQVISRVWMRRQEEAENRRGGVLADDMGLGKTMQALTRIVEDRQNNPNCGPTLVVCPVAVIGQWAKEIRRVVKDIVVVQHHGHGRGKDAAVLQLSNVIITSFQTVVSEYNAWQLDAELAQSAQMRSALFRVHWRRVVLDEAHKIKDRTTKSAMACFALEADFRWCLTGTPVQNDVEEFYSYIKFLRIAPMDQWPIFNTQIARPYKGKDAEHALKTLHVILRTFMLRRTKDSVPLSPRHVSVEVCHFNPAERMYYDALEVRLKQDVERAYHNNHFAAILVALLRLRQACCHFSVGLTPSVEALNSDLPASGIATDMEPELTVLATADVATHPIIECSYTESTAQSTKLRKLVELLQSIRARPGNEKTLVFSNFIGMLDLIASKLNNDGVGFVRYQGTMSPAEREDSLRKIEHESSITCILMSIRAGGTGLNMTMCCNVILMDPWWNPALEEQAFDRVHRVGQMRPVHIYKLIVKQSIEERVIRVSHQLRQSNISDHVPS